MKQTKIDIDGLTDFFAPIMFCLSLMFLVLLAALIVVWVEIPRFTVVNEAVGGELAEMTANDSMAAAALNLGVYFVNVVWVLGFLIVGETITMHVLRIRHQRPDDLIKRQMRLLAHCLCPPLRLAAANPDREGKIWLPWIGWQSPGRKLLKRLQAVFSRPMLFFAVLILPVLLVEFGLHSFVEYHPWLRLTLHICTGLIWCAFAIEFIVLLNASDRKFSFVKKNWIDLAIILLPMIMFLRSLRALRMMRLAQIARAQQLTNLSRVYRVRGVAMKAFRALMLLEVFGRMLPTDPQKKLKRLQRDFNDAEEDLNEMREELEKLKLEVQKKQAEASAAKTAAALKLPASPPSAERSET